LHSRLSFHLSAGVYVPSVHPTFPASRHSHVLVRPMVFHFANIHTNDSITTRTAAVIEFSILLLSLVGIRRASLHGDSHLARLLKTQGITYFVMAFLIQVSAIAVGQAHIDSATRMCVAVSGSILSPILSCRLVTSTLSDDSLPDYSPGPQTLRFDAFELSEGQGRNRSVGRMTTCIDIDITKDQGVC